MPAIIGFSPPRRIPGYNLCRGFGILFIHHRGRRTGNPRRNPGQHSLGDFGFRFAGACANGNEALELIERDAPDVVMTDTNMPFMDGLTLSERIKAVARRPRCSPDGYDDFEYARKALQLKCTTSYSSR
jgi:DNA-binding NarL/FixJ family response regulator